MMVIKLRSEKKGEHVYESVFIGPDEDYLALAGTLTMRVEEWWRFGRVLGAGAKLGELLLLAGGASGLDDVKVIFEGDEQVLGGPNSLLVRSGKKPHF